MPRFLTRPQFVATSERPVKVSPIIRSTPPGQLNGAVPKHASYLVQYDTLPMRNAAGHALQYTQYKPSRYYVPFSHPNQRNPRQNAAVLPAVTRDASAHLHLDFDSVNLHRARRLKVPTSTASALSLDQPSKFQSTRSNSIPHELYSINHAINLKANALRRHLDLAAHLGDLTVLKRVVANHRDALARVRRARHSVLVQLHDATTFTGLPPPSTAIAPPVHGQYRRPTPIRAYPLPPSAITRVRPILQPPSLSLPASTPVRRVNGRPTMRRLGGRTLSALKARSAPRRSTSHNDIKEIKDNDPPPNRPSLEAFAQTLQATTTRKGFVARSLSRKSSGTLKRLGSAGSMLMRRLSRGSVGNESDSLPSVPVQSHKGDTMPDSPNLSSTLDKDMVSRLQAEPANVISEIEVHAKHLKAEEKEALSRLKSSEKVLDQRREVHSKAMGVLDQFYGNLPGWQQDPITQAMFVETADMTDAALETERDLVEARYYLSQAHAALRDHNLALGAVQSIGEQLAMFIAALERLVQSIADCEIRGRADGCEGIPEFDGDIWPTLRQLEKYLNKCVGSGEMATECCMDARRVAQMGRDLKTLRDGFVGEAKAVESMGRIYQKDLMTSLHIAKSAVCDCKLAETFVREREKMIAEDLENFEEMVERCEEYVIQERIVLVDLHHPNQDDDQGAT